MILECLYCKRRACDDGTLASSRRSLVEARRVHGERKNREKVNDRMVKERLWANFFLIFSLTVFRAAPHLTKHFEEANGTHITHLDLFCTGHDCNGDIFQVWRTIEGRLSTWTTSTFSKTQSVSERPEATNNFGNCPIIHFTVRCLLRNSQHLTAYFKFKIVTSDGV